MSAESKRGPTGKKSRRSFIQKIGTMAAASGIAANAGSAQQAPTPAVPGRAEERNFRPEPGPLSKQPMPTIRLGKHEVGRLVLGVNGIGTHFSDVLGRTYREWNTPEQQMRVFKHCEDLGINLRVQTRDQINQYNKEFGGKMLFTNNSSYPRRPDGTVGDPTTMLKTIAATGPIAIHYAASAADDMWRRGEFGKIREWCKIVRDLGVLVCVNGHIPEMFMEMESQGWDVDYYMPGVYLFGRTHAEWEELFKFNPDLAPLEVGQPATESNSQYYGGEIAWVRGDPPKMLKVIKQVKKPCLVFKILASGNLMANALPKLQQAIVEARFKYVFENIKSADGVVVAMWNKYEDQYALNKEYVVKYGGLSIRA
jgi:hypothetical protein